MDRDLRGTLREFLTLKYGLTYDQCVLISEDFCDFLINYQDQSLVVTSKNGSTYDTYTFVDRFICNQKKRKINMLTKITKNGRFYNCEIDNNTIVEIDFYRTSVESLREIFVGSIWQGKCQKTYIVSKVYIDRYHGGYCVEYSDYGWNFLADLLQNAILIN